MADYAKNPFSNLKATRTKEDTQKDVSQAGDKYRKAMQDALKKRQEQSSQQKSGY